MIAFALGLFAAAFLTALGWRDRPQNRSAAEWSLREIGGRVLAQSAGCVKCHTTEGIADPLESVTASRGPEWIAGHIEDPEMIAPGLREPANAPAEREVAALVAYARKIARSAYPVVPKERETVAVVYARYCVGCHVIDGDGGTDGPNLSRIGSEHDAAYLKRLITDPESVNPDAEMPGFRKRLNDAEVDAVAAYLAARK
jgi:mono/diheme cytochrome c family protein